MGIAGSNRGRFKQPLRNVSNLEHGKQGGQTGHGTSVRVWGVSLHSSLYRRGHGGVLQHACRPQPRGQLYIPVRMVGTRLRAKTRAPTVGAPVMSDASTQMELVTKETSVQSEGCSKCPDPSSGALVNACPRCGQVGDVICQVAELQETVKRLCSIRGAELEIGKWLQNHAIVVATTENEASSTPVTRKSRTPLQPPPCRITIKNKY